MSERIKTVIRFLFKSIVGTLHVVVMLLFIASAFSDRVSPETSVLFSYLGLGFPVFCVLNGCFVCYWLFVWEWRFLLIGLFSFLIAWEPVSSYFPLHRQVKEIPEKQVLKVLTYNVMGFGYKDHTRQSPNPILNYIAKSDADIVCLQEYAVGTTNKFLTNRKIFNALKMYPYHSIVPIGTSGALKFNIAVFSKYPITKSRKIKYESSFNGSSIHELKIAGKKLTLINNHLESFKLTMEDRSRYSDLISSFDADKLQDMRGSISNKLSTAFRIRARQAEAIAEVIREEDKEAYVLVCGDFNDTPISYAHRTIQGPLLDAFAESGSGVGITYNQNFFWFRIDNILHSQNIRSSNCQVEKIPYSDHYPLSCYITLE